MIINKCFSPINSIKTVSQHSKSHSLMSWPCDCVSFSSKKISFENTDFRGKFNDADYEIVKSISDFACKCNTNVYLVGGIVRDMLLGEKANDIDFLVEGDAVEFTKELCKEHPEYKVDYLKDDFGTTKIRINGQNIDIASTREESYIRKAIPVVSKIGCSMKKDVKRRDFTINSMALQLKTNESGEVQFIPVDIANGLDDLNSKTLRATYPKSFEDDPTRIIRGLKFRLRYGMKYDNKTQQLIDQYLNNPPIDEISFSRVDTTLRKLFHNPNMAEKAFSAIIDEKIYKLFTPKINAKSHWGTRIKQACDIFGIEDMANVCMKLLDNKVTAPIIQSYDKNKKTSNYEIYKSFYRKSAESMAIYYIITQDQNALKFNNELKQTKIFLQGADLIAMGIKPGKLIGEILDRILEAKLNGNSINSIDDEIKFVRNYLQSV